MKAFSYFTIQFKLLIVLLCIFPIPLFLFLRFSPYEVEGIQFFFLAFLIILKLSFFQNSTYKKTIEPVAKSKLSKKLKRTPSKSEIVQIVNDYANSRDIVLAINGVLILLLGTFQKFI